MMKIIKRGKTKDGAKYIIRSVEDGDCYGAVVFLGNGQTVTLRNFDALLEWIELNCEARHIEPYVDYEWA